MCKIALCLSMLIGQLSTSLDITEIKNVEYVVKSVEEKEINLKVVLYSSKKDFVELKIFFDNDERNFYSSVLEVIGEINSVATIPILDNGAVSFNLVFNSHNMNKIIKEIEFPLYYTEQDVCYLSKEKVCVSPTPVKVVYDGKSLKKEYEKISLIKHDPIYFTFDNLFPIDKIKIGASLFENRGCVNLIVNGEMWGEEMMNNGKYILPLDVEHKKGIINFAFSNNYYLDMVLGITYDKYISNTIYFNNVIFPYEDNEYKVSIIFEDVFISYKQVIMDLKLVTQRGLIGDCDSNKYCLRRVYL